MKPEELDALIEKYFIRHTDEPSILWPRGDSEHRRWISRHKGKWYVQTGDHSVEHAEGDKYGTLEEAVVCAVALMEMEVKP